MKKVIAFFVVIYENRLVAMRRGPYVGLPQAVLSYTEEISTCAERAVGRCAILRSLGRWVDLGGEDGEWDGEPVSFRIFFFPNAEAMIAPTHPDATLVDIDALSGEPDVSIHLLRRLGWRAPSQVALSA
ncbi:MAG: hypothetical protein HZA81_02880 [Candidatus Taylorbacteria bacterium]|nr:hypothetical protein [Candidatus Taylorbacteria bacterium]